MNVEKKTSKQPNITVSFVLEAAIRNLATNSNVRIRIADMHWIDSNPSYANEDNETL